MRHRLAYAVLVAVTTWSCTKTSPDPSRIRLELPPGFAVKVDDRPAEVEVLEVTPGMHAVEVTTPCGDAKTDIQVEAQQTVTVGVGDFPGLALATLALTITAPSGEKPSPTATLTLLDEARSVDREDHPWPVPQAVFSGGATVPACDLRLKVASGVETLGGYWEDLALTPGSSVSREVRLAPGPDMVRIEGGMMPISVTGPVDDELGREVRALQFERMEIPTFEIDRTEVTAEQFFRCREAKGCPRMVPEEHEPTTHLRPGERRRCAIEHTFDERYRRHERVLPGREQHPANCIPHWEADFYCRWAGKRLPTIAEWEFAARSRREDYAWPWGNEEPGCDRFSTPSYDCHKNPKTDPLPVCRYPRGNTEQGLCDMVSNVGEYIEPFLARHLPEAIMQTDRGTHNLLDPDSHWFDATQQPIGLRREDVFAGFRCARTIGPGKDFAKGAPND